MCKTNNTIITSKKNIPYVIQYSIKMEELGEGGQRRSTEEQKTTSGVGNWPWRGLRY